MKKIISTILFSLIVTMMSFAQTTATSQRTEAEAKKIIDGVYKELIAGADFARMAIRFSEDPGSNNSGGEYDSLKRGMFVPEFEQIVFNLKVNEISKPFITQYGYHIAVLLARRDDVVDVRHILIQFKKPE
jgi:parvulin-like peptidyl-prolyl isomerase